VAAAGPGALDGQRADPRGDPAPRQDARGREQADQVEWRGVCIHARYERGHRPSLESGDDHHTTTRTYSRHHPGERGCRAGSGAVLAAIDTAEIFENVAV